MKIKCFKEYCVRIFCEKVWGVMLPIDCFAILLVIDPMMGFVFLCSSLWWVGELFLSHENTCSEYRIPPQNTPENSSYKKNNSVLDINVIIHSYLKLRYVTRVFGGILGRNPVLPTPTHPPSGPHFFLIFPWFLGFPLLNQRIIRDFGGVPGGGIFSLIFPWI